MSNPYTAFGDRFFVNMCLHSRTLMPHQRDPLLHFTDMMMKVNGDLNHFDRSNDGREIRLESDPEEKIQQWIEMDQFSLRSGHINPADFEQAMKFHMEVIRASEVYLGIRPYELRYMDVLIGHDLVSDDNAHMILAKSLFSDSPVSCLSEMEGAKPIQFMPVFKVGLSDDDRLQAVLNLDEAHTPDGDGVSVQLIIRQYFKQRPADPLEKILAELAARARAFYEEKLVPRVIQPISEVIKSRS